MLVGNAQRMVRVHSRVGLRVWRFTPGKPAAVRHPLQKSTPERRHKNLRWALTHLLGSTIFQRLQAKQVSTFRNCTKRLGLR